MLNMNLEIIAHNIGNSILNANKENRAEFIKTIQTYKFAFITFIEATENRKLKSKEIIEIHNLFTNTITKMILEEYPELTKLYKKEKYDMKNWD